MSFIGVDNPTLENKYKELVKFGMIANRKSKV
jgi:hypothetical protein